MDLEPLLVPPQASLRGVMSRIDRNSAGIALVVDPQRRLLGTITDGDIRRAILAGTDLDQPASLLLGTRPHGRAALTAPADSSPAQQLRLMNEHWVRQLPLVDPAGRVVDMVLMEHLVREREPLPHAVIMAGGQGMRLRPLTSDVPKPMLPVGDRPLLERLVEQLREAGVQRVSLTTHYKGEVIERHFGDGSDRGLEIRYLPEEQPLGTAGALGLLDRKDEPLLVLNGDILTNVSFRAMLDFHREQRAVMTVAVRQLALQVPYGVVEVDGSLVTAISEKPTLRHFVSAGIYLLDPAARAHLPAPGQRYDMPDLIRALLAAGSRVVSFPVREYWIDIGRPDDYLRAQEDHQAGRVD